MTPYSVCLRTALIMCAFIVPARTQPASAPSAPAPNASQAPVPGQLTAVSGEEETVQIKLPDADLDTILSALEIYTGRIILRPAALPPGTYNLQISNPIPKSAAIRYIETVLALNGIGVVKLDDNAYKVTAIGMSRYEAPEMISGTTLQLPPSNKVATKLFHLEFLRVAELAPLLAGILNTQYGQPLQLPNANAVMVTDSIANLQRVEVLLQQVDKPFAISTRPKFYQLQEANAADMVAKLRLILQGTLNTQLGIATTLHADDRTNQVILVTDPRQHPFFDDLIARLDVRADPATRNDVIELNHAKAEDVVKVLVQLISGQTRAIQQRQTGSGRPGQLSPQPGQPMLPGQSGPLAAANITSAAGLNAAGDNVPGAGSSEFSSMMTVVNDDRTNAVVVSGTASDIRLLRELVAKLDRVLAQVRIEVVIAEVTLDDQDASGISALGLRVDGDKLVGFAGSFQGVGDSNPFTLSNGAVLRPGASGAWDLATEISIGTTPRKRDSAIIGVPAIVTSHGKKAEFFNGETRPVVTGTLQSAAGVSSGLASSSTVAQQQIGTRLIVTPYIGVDGSVQIDLVSNVEDVIGEVLVDRNTQYVIGKRETTSYITAKSGEIIVVAGFRKSANTKSSSRLGPIPILGDLLGGRTRGKSQQELIFFLRPTVLTNNPAIDNAEALRRVEQMRTREEIKKELAL